MSRRVQVLVAQPERLADTEESLGLGLVELMSKTRLDAWAGTFTNEEVDAIVEAWQTYAGKRYKNMIVAQEHRGVSA